MSAAAIGYPQDGDSHPLSLNPLSADLAIHTAPTERAEAESIVKAIEEMIGGHSFFSIDTGPASGHPPSTR